MQEQELLDLKQEIDQAKENITKLQGRKDAMLETMQKNYGVKSIKAAQKKLEEMQEELAEWEEQLQAAINTLEDKVYEK